MPIKWRLSSAPAHDKLRPRDWNRLRQSAKPTMAKRPKKSALPLQKERERIPRSRLPSLLGRETEIDLIDQLLDRIDQGGATLFISGAAGIGKSALLEEAKDRARERGIAVLGMTGVLAEAHLAFAGLQQALHPLMKQAKSLPAHQRSALLSAFGMGGATIEAPDIWLVALATLALLTEGPDYKPILLAVDDAQWLDEPTRQVLSFVSRRLSSDPVVLLLALREGFELPFGDANTLRHAVPALSEADATRLLEMRAPGLSENLRNRFLREAAGNPLALVELPRSSRSEDDREAAWLPLTERLERTFSSRLSDVPEVTRMLLYIAAENDGSSLYEIMRAGEVLLARTIDFAAFEPAVLGKLIELDATEARFRHPLVRSAIHQAADMAIRQRVHAALAGVIEDQDRKLWHRAAAATGPDDELAGELDQMAHRAQRRGAVTTVVEVLQIAARLSKSAEARRERFLKAAEIAMDLGRPKLLDHLLREAAVDPSDELGTARVGWCREMSQFLTINDPGRISALVKFADQAHAGGAKDLASNLLWRAAQRCWWSNAGSDPSSNVLSATRRLKLLELDPRGIAISAYAEPLRRGGEVYAKLKALSERRGNDPHVARILGSTANVVGAFDLGVSFLTESTAELRKQGRIGNLSRALFAQAWAEMEVGDWIGAMREAEEAIRFAEEIGSIVWRAAATIVKAKVAGMQGNLSDPKSMRVKRNASFCLVARASCSRCCNWREV